jgi:hypothetical protein
MAAGDDVPWFEREWIEDTTSTRLRKGYISSTVRKELLQGLPYEVGNVSKTKMDEVRLALNTSVRQIGFEEIVEMYI